MLCLMVPLIAAGCHVRPNWLRRGQVDLPPEAFTQSPTLDDVIYVVNANTTRIEKLQTENATLRIEGVSIPPLKVPSCFAPPRDVTNSE